MSIWAIQTYGEVSLTKVRISVYLIHLSLSFFQYLIFLEAEKVRKEEEARLRKKLGAKKAAEEAEKKAQVPSSISSDLLCLKRKDR